MRMRPRDANLASHFHMGINKGEKLRAFVDKVLRKIYGGEQQWMQKLKNEKFRELYKRPHTIYFANRKKYSELGKQLEYGKGQMNNGSQMEWIKNEKRQTEERSEDNELEDTLRIGEGMIPYKEEQT